MSKGQPLMDGDVGMGGRYGGKVGFLMSQELGGTLGELITGRLVLTIDLFFCLLVKYSKEEEEKKKWEAAISQC